MQQLLNEIPAIGGPTAKGIEKHIINIPNAEDDFLVHLKMLRATMFILVMNNPSSKPNSTENITRSW